ncbi:MAG: MBL fold metallo-hydrolase [bacterium]
MNGNENIRLPEGLTIIEPPVYNWPYSTAIFAVRDEKGHTLIETGCGGPDAVEHTLSSLDSHGISAKSIHTILVSHAHPDHFGAINKLLEAAPGAEVVIHEREADAAVSLEGLYRNFDFHLAGKYTGSSGPQLDSVIDVFKFNIFKKECQAGSRAPHRTAKAGEVTEAGPLRLRWVLTPGHSPGHIAFHDEKSGVLFSGDLVGRNPAWYAPAAGGVTGYLASLDAISALEPALLLPSHSPPVADPQAAISDVRDNLMKREERILDLLSRGEADFKRVVDELFASHFTIFPGSPIIECHLQKLIGEEKVVEENGKYRLV